MATFSILSNVDRYNPGSSMEKGRGVRVVSFRGYRAVLIPLRVFTLKSSTATAFDVPFRVLSRKKMVGDHAVF